MLGGASAFIDWRLVRNQKLNTLPSEALRMEVPAHSESAIVEVKPLPQSEAKGFSSGKENYVYLLYQGLGVPSHKACIGDLYLQQETSHLWHWVPSWPFACIPLPPQKDILANELLLHLTHRWVNGPSSLSSVQREKGEKILQALGRKAAHSNVPWLMWQNTRSSTCVALGSAKLVRKGEEPCTLLLLHDFKGASVPIRFGDSLSGCFFDGVEWPDFLEQRDQLRAGHNLKNSEPIFSAIDIPSTKKGFRLCRYSLKPFEDEKECTVAPLSSAWTLPGYITLPHMDEPVTGLYTIHWKGDKLWILCPATQENMKKMEDMRLSMPNLDATLSLVETLEGLKIMFLTQDEYMEFSFYLLPNVIHTCLSFTECCHSGSYIHSFKFISQVQSIVDWELE
ncbi:hypothetical protein H1R20_g13434, partial [Candolleomyces eurysporus]